MRRPTSDDPSSRVTSIPQVRVVIIRMFMRQRQAGHAGHDITQRKPGDDVSRLFAIDREQLPPEQRRFHDAVMAIRRRPVSGPFIVLMNSSPDLAARFAHLGHYFHSRGQADESILSLRVRTFVALLGSRALDVPYEWSAWVGW